MLTRSFQNPVGLMTCSISEYVDTAEEKQKLLSMLLRSTGGTYTLHTWYLSMTNCKYAATFVNVCVCVRESMRVLGCCVRMTSEHVC